MPQLPRPALRILLLKIYRAAIVGWHAEVFDVIAELPHALRGLFGGTSFGGRKVEVRGT